jgi:hypothetical protein
MLFGRHEAWGKLLRQRRPVCLVKGCPEMAKFYTELDETQRKFIAAQRMFFNASAPNQGRVNLSPKGLDTFRILSDKRVALILRLYGRGWVVRPRDSQWDELRALFPPLPGERQIIVLDIESIMTTCGFAVPLYHFKGHREALTEFTCKMGEQRMDEYRHERNQWSIDGLPTHLFDDSPK